MKKVKIVSTYSVFESKAELPDSDRLLLEKAKEALAHSYSPYSHFKVGAAVLLENGEIVTGSNYENASYPITVCGEHAAIIAAANRFPESPVLAVAICVKNPRQVIERPALPCGSCRQVICETEMRHRRNIKVILQGETGVIYVFEKGSDILPLAFDGSYL